MAADNGADTPGLINNLVQDGQAYHVWQAVWLCEQITKNKFPERKDFLFEQTGLRFRPHENYEYPPRDIRAIKYSGNEIEFVLNFLGLYGINSPLPRCYHEQVAIQLRTLGEGSVPLQDFYDLFNNRFYWLYYQSWKKYKFYLFLNRDLNNKVVERINSFTGRGLFSKSKESVINDLALLKFSGLFSSRVRNKNGLSILLSYFFPKYKMEIKEFVPKWIKLSGIPSLGDDGFILGENSYIGEYAVDYMSRICIKIGTLTFEEYINFLPGTEQSKRLIELLKLYLNDGLEFDFEFKIDPDTIAMISWDDERLKLGSTLWLGKPDRDDVNVRLNYEELTSSLTPLLAKERGTGRG